jgi:DNA-binding transcriptional MerR regulator
MVSAISSSTLSNSATVTSIENLSDSPKYNIKAVCAQTSIRPVTLRAWERRYQLLNPHRTNSNYRLYSERDLAILRWLKSRVDSGLPISTVATELMEMRRMGVWPESVPQVKLATSLNPHHPVAPSAQALRLYKALVAHDEALATETINETYAMYDVATVCLEVVTPCLVRIGDAWQQGQIRIITEHFASNFLRGRLMSLFQAQPTPRATPRIIIGCAPSELHEIGSLMLALLLRREGYRVEFLGQDVHVDDLLEYVRLERPALICLAASTEASARELRRVHNGLTNMRPRPKFGFGGRVFNLKPALRESIPGVFLGENLRDAVAHIRQVLSS